MAAGMAIDTGVMNALAKKQSWIKQTCKYCGREFYAPTPRAEFCSNSHRTAYYLAVSKGGDPIVMCQIPEVKQLREQLATAKEQLEDTKLSVAVEKESSEDLRKQIQDLEWCEYLLRCAVSKQYEIPSKTVKSSENMVIRGIHLEYIAEKKVHRITKIEANAK